MSRGGDRTNSALNESNFEPIDVNPLAVGVLTRTLPFSKSGSESCPIALVTSTRFNCWHGPAAIHRARSVVPLSIFVATCALCVLRNCLARMIVIPPEASEARQRQFLRRPRYLLWPRIRLLLRRAELHRPPRPIWPWPLLLRNLPPTTTRFKTA